jgi:uncharacterized membrane protein YciS (DUF1049 family)
MYKLRQAVIIVLVLLMLVGGLSLGLFNSQMVRFDYLAGQVELPLIALLVLSAVFTLLLAALASTILYLRLRRRVSRLQKDLDRVQQKDAVATRLPANRQ